MAPGGETAPRCDSGSNALEPNYGHAGTAAPGDEATRRCGSGSNVLRARALRRPGDPKDTPPPIRFDGTTKQLVDDRTALIDFHQRTNHMIPSDWWVCRLSNRDLPLADILAEARHELLHNRNFKAVSYTHLTLPTILLV